MPSSDIPTSSPPDTAVSERLARVALAMERYLLPLVYLWLIYIQLRTVHLSYLDYHVLARAGLHPMSWPLFCASVTKYVLLSILLAFTGFALLINRQPTHLPNKLIHISVPLAMSFYVAFYGMVNQFPESLRENLMPVAWRVPAAMAAVLISTIGYAVSIWGICNLGRSFAILVSVRRVVTSGPYRYVRHPMYFGYLLELAGLLLASLSLGMLLLGAGFVFLMVIRARLEEERLAEAYPGYRDYMQHTGFLLPRFITKTAVIG